jgi:hypothetical protein
MGTSSNHPSPNIPIWRPARAILGRTDWPAERQSREIWQGALADRGGRLPSDLGDPLLAEACRLAESRLGPFEAVQSFHNSMNANYAAGLPLEMGKRALARAAAAGSGAEGFASELFAEVASYYVARDLPSYVGEPGRVGTTTDSIQFKEQIRGIARETARTAGEVRTDPEGWQRYVSAVLAALQRKGGAG